MHLLRVEVGDVGKNEEATRTMRARRIGVVA